MQLSNVSDLKSLLARHGFSFSKGLGQNFIVSPSVCPRMADACCLSPEKSGVVEIGPGIGVLTRELALRARQVVSLELDTRLFPILEETLADLPNVTVLHADAMKTDFATLLREQLDGCEDLCVCANLPYYITSPILMKLLEARLPLRAVTVMVQKEAAERLTAEVGSRQAGAVTVAVRYFSVPERLFSVPRGCFLPPPNVDSAVIRLTLRHDAAQPGFDERLFFRLVRAGFEQRRKTLCNALGSAGIPKEAVCRALGHLDLPSTVRAEALRMEFWQALAAELAEFSQE